MTFWVIQSKGPNSSYYGILPITWLQLKKRFYRPKFNQKEAIVGRDRLYILNSFLKYLLIIPLSKFHSTNEANFSFGNQNDIIYGFFVKFNMKSTTILNIWNLHFNSASLGKVRYFSLIRWKWMSLTYWLLII